jgi:hypothetical protein
MVFHIQGDDLGVLPLKELNAANAVQSVPSLTAIANIGSQCSTPAPAVSILLSRSIAAVANTAKQRYCLIHAIITKCALVNNAIKSPEYDSSIFRSVSISISSLHA